MVCVGSGQGSFGFAGRRIAEDMGRLDVLNDRLARTSRHPATLELTESQVRALDRAARGLTREQLKDDLKDARRKLGARHTAHAVAIAVRKELV